MKPVVWAVNFIRSHASTHRQFQIFLKEIDAEYSDLPYRTAIRWLSCGKVLLRFYNLRKEINLFLTDKNKGMFLESLSQRNLQYLKRGWGGFLKSHIFTLVARAFYEKSRKQSR